MSLIKYPTRVARFQILQNWTILCKHNGVGTLETELPEQVWVIVVFFFNKKLYGFWRDSFSSVCTGSGQKFVKYCISDLQTVMPILVLSYCWKNLLKNDNVERSILIFQLKHTDQLTFWASFVWSWIEERGQSYSCDFINKCQRESWNTEGERDKYLYSVS